MHAAIARSQRCPTTQRRPSFTSGHIFERGASAVCSRQRLSRWRMRSMKSVETTKLAASTTIA